MSMETDGYKLLLSIKDVVEKSKTLSINMFPVLKPSR